MPTVFLTQGWQSETSGNKFVVECREITKADPVSNSITRLHVIDPENTLGMSHPKLVEGMFGGPVDGTRKVVIKIADTSKDIEAEWHTYEALSSIGADGKPPPNFLRYHCFFRCDATIARFVEATLDAGVGEGLCDGIGDSMQVIVMEHLDGKSMKHFEWGGVDIEVIRNCVLQVVYAMLDAYLACGFVHGDLHIENVLIHRSGSDRTSIRYERLRRDGGGAPLELPVHDGIVVLLMDFELSSVYRTSPSNHEFFNDIAEFFRLSLADLGDHVNGLDSLYMTTRAWAEQARETTVDPRMVLNIRDHLSQLQKVTRGCPYVLSPPRKRIRPYLKKRRGVW
jgi:serine/threonine protein kinase